MLGALLALTLGLLVFLLIDTLLEAFEVAASLPGAFQGIPLVLFAALLTWLVLLAIGSGQRSGAGATSPRAPRNLLTALIAFSIGLHNLGEGLAIGAAFALGEAAVGSFLVIGFTLHNITEGVGIAAPLVSPKHEDGEFAAPKGPSLLTFLGIGAGSRSPSHPGRVDRWLCILTAAGVYLPGHGRGRHLAGHCRSNRAAAGLRQP